MRQLKVYSKLSRGNSRGLAAIRTNWLSELITKFDEIQSNILIKYCSFIQQLSRLCFSRSETAEISPSHLSAIWTSCECRHRWNPDTAITTSARSRILQRRRNNKSRKSPAATNRLNRSTHSPSSSCMHRHTFGPFSSRHRFPPRHRTSHLVDKPVDHCRRCLVPIIKRRSECHVNDSSSLKLNARQSQQAVALSKCEPKKTRTFPLP